jgi:hypothetical protein
MDLFKTILKLFSGGLSGAVSNFALLVGVVIATYKIKKILKKKTLESSLDQAKDERTSQIKQNQTKDSAQAVDEDDIDTWRKEVRNGRKKGTGSTGPR